MDGPRLGGTSDPRAAGGNDIRPSLLGLAGDSASGKSTLSRGIEYVLGAERVGRVCTDDYHRFDRAERSRLGVTPLAPQANRMDLLARHLHALASGLPVTKPTYRHQTGAFGSDEVVEPGEIVIVEGLLPLASLETRDAIDVAVFLEPDETLRRRWKLERDVFDRGYSARQVVEEIHRREADAEAYVRPQRSFADVIVGFHAGAGRPVVERLSARLTVRPTLPSPSLRELVGSLRTGERAPIRWNTQAHERGPVSVLEIDGDCPPSLGAEIEEVLWSSLRPDDRLQRDRIGVVRTPGQGERRSEALALAQLLIVSHLFGALGGASEL